LIQVSRLPSQHLCIVNKRYENEKENSSTRRQQTVIANAGYDKATAEAELEKGIAQLVSFGTLFLANLCVINE
jgi:2,4-dienoyl-CoA reductase-like NADH-dependent reductase (Old Yellow Enzyme family)